MSTGFSDGGGTDRTLRTQAIVATWVRDYYLTLQASSLHMSYENLASLVASITDEMCPGQGELLRDIVGNPFQEPVFDRSWVTPTIRSLAEAAYTARLICVGCHGSGDETSDGQGVCSDCMGSGWNESGHLDGDRFLVMADALQDRGAPDTEVCRECNGAGVYPGSKVMCMRCNGSGRQAAALLSHLRGGQHHVKGCWALDRILGKG